MDVYLLRIFRALLKDEEDEEDTPRLDSTFTIRDLELIVTKMVYYIMQDP